MKILKRSRSPEILFSLRNSIGIAHYFLGDWESALKFFQGNIDEGNEENKLELGISMQMAAVLMGHRYEHHFKAKKYLEISLQIFESLKIYHWMITGLTDLAYFYYSVREWRPALNYLHKSLEISEILQNKTFALFTYAFIARVKLRCFGIHSQEVRSAIIEVEKVILNSREKNHSWSSLWALHYLATFYALQGELSKMKAMIDELIPLTEGSKHFGIYVLSNLGHFAALSNEYDKARDYYRRAYEEAHALNNKFAIREIRQDFLDCSLPLHLQDFASHIQLDTNPFKMHEKKESNLWRDLQKCQDIKVSSFEQESASHLMK